jgi:hypothetical protein
MPSIVPTGAFLTLFNPKNWDPLIEDNNNNNSDAEKDNDEPQKDFGPLLWPAFQAHTGIMRPIFSPTPLAGTPQAWSSQRDNAAVWSFITKFWSLPKTQKVTFISCKTKDNNSLGRTLYLDWLKAEYPRWSVNQVVLSSLCECGVDPYSSLRLLDGGQGKVCLPSPFPLWG